MTPLILYQLLILAVLLVLLGFVFVNLAVLPRLSVSALRGDAPSPSVAILVPARNEADNIGACVRSLMAQDYPSFTVWVYDDLSSDVTLQILQRVAVEEPRLHVIEGREEPSPGWLGKANACYRLYEAMSAEIMPNYVLFTDADVRFASSAVRHAVATAEARGAGLLSVFPRQITISWAERLAVPVLLHWAVYSFLPLPLAFSRQAGPAFAAANGQFMLFTRRAYEACGGHAAVRSLVLEDVGLARAVKRAGFLALLADGASLMQTRMYNGPSEVWRGYSKNAYAFFGYSPFFLAIGLVILVALYVAPLGFLIYAAISGQPLLLVLSLAQYVTAVVARLLLALRFAYRPTDALVHPIAVLFLIAILLNSVRWKLTGKGDWKGRAA